MKIVHIRFNDNDKDFVEWIEKLAKNESLPVSTFIRVFMAREYYRSEREKEFAKKGKKEK